MIVDFSVIAEVKEEYIARYLDGNIGKATWGPLANHRPVLVDHVLEDNGPLSPTVIAKLPPLDVTVEEARLLGYKPHRDDYDSVKFHLTNSPFNNISDCSKLLLVEPPKNIYHCLLSLQLKVHHYRLQMNNKMSPGPYCTVLCSYQCVLIYDHVL